MKRLKVDIFSPSFFTFHAFSWQPNWFITTFNSEGNGEFFFSLKFLMGLVSFLFKYFTIDYILLYYII